LDRPAAAAAGCCFTSRFHGYTDKHIDPDRLANRYTNSYSLADSHGYCYGYQDWDSYPNTYPFDNFDSYPNGHNDTYPYAHTDIDLNSHFDRHANAHQHCYPYGYTNLDANAYPHTNPDRDPHTDQRLDPASRLVADWRSVF
jgi:hypothetical protein